MPLLFKSQFQSSMGRLNRMSSDPISGGSADSFSKKLGSKSKEKLHSVTNGLSGFKDRSSEAKDNLDESLAAFKDCWDTTIKQRKTATLSTLVAAPGVLAYHAVDIVAESICLVVCESARYIIEDTNCPELIADAIAVGAILLTTEINSVRRRAKLVIGCINKILVYLGRRL